MPRSECPECDGFGAILRPELNELFPCGHCDASGVVNYPGASSNGRDDPSDLGGKVGAKTGGATPPTGSDAFQNWWRASKYCQVVRPEAGREQIASDGWNAAESTETVRADWLEDEVARLYLHLSAILIIAEGPRATDRLAEIAGIARSATTTSNEPNGSRPA